MHVTPAPDGRGASPPKGPRTRMSMPRPRFIVIVLVLLAINYAAAAILGPGHEPTIQVPYNPTFLKQVKAGNVERISAQGETVEGKFKKAVKQPGKPKGKAALKFETEVPTFANEEELSALLESKGVIVQAERLQPLARPPQRGR
jgi:cell division protease FtsH